MKVYGFPNPVSIYLFKANNRNTRTRYEYIQNNDKDIRTPLYCNFNAEAK